MKKRSRFFKFAVIATAVVLVVCCFLQHDNLIAWIRAGHTVSQQRRQIEQYRRDIATLDSRIESMTTDRDTLETYARERFHFAESGEDIYLIEEGRQSKGR